MKEENNNIVMERYKICRECLARRGKIYHDDMTDWERGFQGRLITVLEKVDFLLQYGSMEEWRNPVIVGRGSYATSRDKLFHGDHVCGSCGYVLEHMVISGGVVKQIGVRHHVTE